MQKIESFHKGQVWVNVYKTDDGRTLFTITKSFLTPSGWRRSQFFRPAAGDVKHIIEALRMVQPVQEVSTVGGATPSILASDWWIDEEELPVRADLRIVNMTDPDYRMTQDEIEDRNEFIRCYILRSHEALLSIPKQNHRPDFFIKDYEESAFNTGDFHRLYPSDPFDRYEYAIRKVMERAKDLAILHSCISDQEGRERTRRRFESLLRSEFEERLAVLSNQALRAAEPERREEIARKISDVNRRIIQCRKVWEQFAPWDS